MHGPSLSIKAKLCCEFARHFTFMFCSSREAAGEKLRRGLVLRPARRRRASKAHVRSGRNRRRSEFRGDLRKRSRLRRRDCGRTIFRCARGRSRFWRAPARKRRSGNEKRSAREWPGRVREESAFALPERRKTTKRRRSVPSRNGERELRNLARKADGFAAPTDDALGFRGVSRREIFGRLAAEEGARPDYADCMQARRFPKRGP